MEHVEKDGTEAGVIAELAVKAAGEVRVIELADGRQFLVKPEGFRAEQITAEGWQSGVDLKRIEQSVTLQSTDSLVDYVNRYKTGETMLFADIGTNTIVSVHDFHGPANNGGEVKSYGLPQRGMHRASLVLPYSEEWKTWTAISGKLDGQLNFARFLEENAADIETPDAATLIECCRDLQAVRRVNFTKAVRTSSNNENFEYTDETETRTKGGVEIPTEFVLRLPVYFNGATTELKAFLRHHLDDGVLKLGVQLHRAEHVRQAIFKQIVMDVAARTEAPVVFGRPS